MGLLTRPPGEDHAGTVYLWPCNVAAWNAFMGLQTQWRTGMAGPTGLDYQGVLADLRGGLQLRGQVLRDTWSGIKACERAVLDVWADERVQREEERQQGRG